MTLGYVFSRTVSSAALLMAAAFLCVLPAMAAGNAQRKLQIYFVDVEGGQATLFVSPDHHSLLIDTGWPDNNGRDADRIVTAAKQAGVARIDTVLLTHYHDDHVGGVSQLVARIPVGMFIDHGPNREIDGGVTQHGYELYQQQLATGKYKHVIATPGEALPAAGFDATVISADGKLIDHSLTGGGETNKYCAASAPQAPDKTENARSLGILLRFGKLKILDLGDLTWDKEMELMCPVNRLGHIDLLVVSHHGWYQSSSPALVDAIAPEVAIMDNGATKGGSTPTLDTIRKAPGLQQLWQLHYSEEGGATHNANAAYIANLKGPAQGNPDAGYYLRVTAERDGEFSIFNSRTGQSKQYTAHS
ncbi:MAG: ComEC/Rec2 family competence protein [Acidobacteriaceae bacterium]